MALRTPEAGNLGYVSHYYYRNEDLALGVLSGLGLTFDDIFRGNQSEITSVIGLDAHAYVDRLTIAGQFASGLPSADNDDMPSLTLNPLPADLPHDPTAQKILAR